MYPLENEINCSFFIAVYMLSVSLLCTLCPFTEIYLCHTSTWLGWWWCCCVCVCLCAFFFFFSWGGVTYWSGRSVNSAYELFNLRAQKISTLYKNYIFQCTGNICMWNLKGTLWNSTKHILPIYSEVYFFISQAKIWELLDLRPHKCFWNGAQINIRLFLWYTFGCMESVHKAFYFFRTILYFLQFRSIQFIYKTNTYFYASKLF